MIPARDRGEGMGSKGSEGQRFWEVDAARGIAIAMMVVYHLAYDLDYFGGYDIDATSGSWARFADATASTFLFLVGVSLAISYSRTRQREPGRSLFAKYLLRGLGSWPTAWRLPRSSSFSGWGWSRSVSCS